MKAVTWQGRRKFEVREVAGPANPGADRRDRDQGHLDRRSAAPTCTSTRCSGRSSTTGDILGHEPMGIVEEVGAEVTDIAAGRPGGDPVQHLLRPLLDVRPRGCTPSARPPRSASRARARPCSATPSSTARCRAARPSTCACRRRSTARSRCPDGPPDERFLYLSDVLPTAWQAVEYADVAGGRHARRARPRPDRPDGRPDRPAPRRRRVIGVDLVPERLATARRARGRDARPRRAVDDVAERAARADRRPRARRRDRRGRHGGARRPGRQGGADGRRAAARRGRQAADRARPAIDRLAALHHRDRRASAAAARSRSAASTAARPTRCR